VPNGGWLDGCLNVVAAVEVLRRVAEEGTPPLTIRLVNWADEEGARFGRSLFGSSAAAGSMSDQDELRERRDAEGVALPDALAEHGVDLDRALEARTQLEGAAAYLELHIEQGPVLESLDLPLGVVLGTFGVERHLVTFRGQAAHAGSTPMDQRRDALAGARSSSWSFARSRSGSAAAPSARWVES
jgi:Acetylornithine deacetylase/Succinyl-diaminopimelate desuccinylase and related deacylases